MVIARYTTQRVRVGSLFLPPHSRSGPHALPLRALRAKGVWDTPTPRCGGYCHTPVQPSTASSLPTGRRVGNRITSRMLRVPVNSITRRSMPMPSPPQTGRP